MRKGGCPSKIVRADSLRSLAEGHQRSPHCIAGRLAFVTGAARGLGRAYAKTTGRIGCVGRGRRPESALVWEFEAEAKDMTADSIVAETEASGGVAFGVE